MYMENSNEESLKIEIKGVTSLIISFSKFEKIEVILKNNILHDPGSQDPRFVHVYERLDWISLFTSFVCTIGLSLSSSLFLSVARLKLRKLDPSSSK